MNILLTGGRAPATLCLARDMKNIGCNIFVAESMKYHLCKYSNVIAKNYIISSPRENLEKYKDDLLNIIKSNDIDLVIPTCEETFYVSMIKNDLLKYCDVFVDDLNKLNNFHNKYSFINNLSENIFVKKPVTRLVKSIDELISRANSMFDIYDKLVLKPVYSRFSSKVLIITKIDLDNLSIDINDDNKWILQEYIIGEQICSYSVVKQGKVLSTVLYPTTFKAGIGASITFENIFNDNVVKFINDLVKEKKYNGQIGFDFIKTNKGEFCIIEANPRLTSGVHLIAKDVWSSVVGNNFSKNTSSKNKFMLAIAMFTYGLFSIRSLKKLSKWCNAIIECKDVVFDFKDIKPFFAQFGIFLVMFIEARRKRITALEYSTIDIEWNGDI